MGGRRHQRGQQFQRDDSYDRYWMNASTGAHAGGDITFGDTQLRELGLDPSNHEEAKILR